MIYKSFLLFLLGMVFTFPCTYSQSEDQSSPSSTSTNSSGKLSELGDSFVEEVDNFFGKLFSDSSTETQRRGQEESECAFIVNEVDDFTGEVKRETESRIYKRNTYNEVFLHLKRDGDAYLIQLHHFNTDQSIANPALYESEENDVLMIKLTDGEILTLPPTEYAFYSRQENASVASDVVLGRYGFLSKKNKYIFEPIYQISQAQVAKLAETQIERIRVQCSGKFTYTQQLAENIDIELDEDARAGFMKAASCAIE